MRSWQDDLGHYEFHRGYGSQEDEVNVFIHGLGFDMTTWDPLWEILDRQSSWLRYNLHGHGGRDYQPFDNPNIHAIDLANLLDMLHIKTVHIIGHGLGGNMGLLFATMYPQRVRSLTILSAHLFLYESVREDILAYRRHFSSSDTLTPLAEIMAPLICQHKNHHSNIIAAYAQIQPSAYFNHLNKLVVDEYNRVVCEYTNLRTPILHMVGEYDASCPAYLYGIATKIFMNSRFLVIPHASNAVHLDQPAQVAALTNAFIQSCSHENQQEYVKPSTLHQELVQNLIYNPAKINQMSIQLMGNFVVKINGTEIKGNWNIRKARQLLAYLVFHSTVTRDHLSQALWGDYEYHSSHNYLRVSLDYVKKLLEKEFPNQTFFQIEQQAVTLTGNIECDIVEALYKLQRFLDGDDLEPNEKEIQQLMNQIIHANLDFFGSELWFTPIQAKLEQRLIAVAKKLSDYFFQRGQYMSAMHAWEYGLAFDESDPTLNERMLTGMEWLGDSSGI